RVPWQRPPQDLLGHVHDVGQGGVGERVGGGVGNGARHVADGVVDHTVAFVHGVGVGRLVRRLDAAALVDGDVDDDGPLPHAGRTPGAPPVRTPRPPLWLSR